MVSLTAAPSGWSLTIPSGTDLLYVSIASISDSNAISFSAPLQLEGSDGSDGTDGDSTRLIYRRSAAAPPLPTGGTWDGTVFGLPSGWSLTNPSGTDQLYACAVVLSGTDKTNSGISYVTVLLLSGDDTIEIQYSNDNSSWHTPAVATDRYLRIRTGAGAWSVGLPFGGVPGGFQATLFQRSANQPAAPTNVTYNPTSLGNPYGGTIGNWVPNVPTGSDQLWRVEVTVPPAITTGNLPVTVNGSVYSERGTDGTDGSDGAWFRPVYQWSETEPTDPSGLSYNIQNGTIEGLGPWREAPAQDRGIPLWIASIKIDGTTAVYEGKVKIPAIAGASGDSITVIYRRSSTNPTAPTGGTYNDSRDFDPPNDWHESIPGGTDPVYLCVVSLSGTNRTNTGISYGSVIKLTGEDGSDGDSLRMIFTRDATDPTTPTGGTWDGTSFDPGAGWF